MKRRSLTVMMGIALTLTLMFAGMFFSAQNAYAEQDDGATTETLTDGQTYDFSTVTTGAHYVKITSGGKYTLKGTASNSMVIIDVPEGQTAKVYLDGVKLAPDSSAPGTENNRAAMQIMDNGGNVELISTRLSTNEFHGQGHMPAIRKDGKKTKLTFDTEDHEHRGTIKAYADKDGYRTCAIGCYSPNVLGLSEIWANTCGNLFFEEGIIEAWGSQRIGHVPGKRWQGGAAIGSNGYGSVHGITINGGYIYAHAGDNTAAAIGTSAAFSDDLYPYPTVGSCARDITINGGIINAYHEDEFSEAGGHITLGGAAIGSGWRSDVERLTINGGTINVDQTGVRGYVGIGAGSEGDASGVVINGGDINIKARFTGIGGGFCGGYTDFSIDFPDITEMGEITPVVTDNMWFGDCDVTINGGNIKIDVTEGTGIGGWKPDSPSGNVTIYGGKIEIDATGGKDGSCIGPGYHGRLKRITIHGGEFDLKAKGDGSAIGGQIPYDKYNVLTFVNNITITGGTINATGGAGMGGIREQKGRTLVPSNIYINGGNVKTELYKNCQPVNDDDVKLRLCKINLKIRPLESLQERIPVTSFDCTLEDGSSYEYLLGDVKTFVPESQLWFWLPEKAAAGGVKLSKPLDKDKTFDTFSGLLEKTDSGQHDFWPPVPLILHLQPGVTSPADGHAKAGYLSTKSTEFVPVNEEETQGLYVKDGYYIEGSGHPHIILDKDGNFVYPGDNDCKIYVNSKNQWIYEDNLAAFRGVHLFADLEVLKYDLSFDSNLPDGASTELTFEDGKSWPADMNGLEARKQVQLPGDSDFWLPGYSFDGWDTKADGTGKRFSAGAVSGLELRRTTKDPEKVKLYAQWSPRKYKVNFNPEGGTGSMGPQEMTFDKPAALTANGFAKDGSEFTGWVKTHVVGGRLYADKQTVVNICGTPSKDGVSDVSLSAVWRQTGTALVTVNWNDSPVTGLTVTAKGGGLSFPLAEDQGNPGSYVSGEVAEGSWQVEISGGEVPFDTNGKTLETNAAGTGTLMLDYADVSISPDSAGIDTYIRKSDGSHADSLTAVPVGRRIHISSQTESGRVFDRYRAKKNVPQMDFHQCDQDITIIGQTDIFAYAREVYYFLHLDPNGGSGDALDMELSYTQEEALPKSPFTREGWLFKGWNTKADGSGTAYEDGQTVSAITDEDGATIWLFAQWEKRKPNVAIISYDLNGGTLDGRTGIITEEHEVGEVITVMKAPKKKGYKFSYWKGSKYHPGDKYTVAEDHTLTAMWTKNGNGNGTDTGDGTNLWLWLALFITSATLLLILCTAHALRTTESSGGDK